MKKTLLLFILSLYLTTEKVQTTIITVPRHYPTIQEAINAAIAGDTIEITAGTYTTSDTINKSLTIIGAGDNTIIAPPSGNGFTITASNVVVQSVSISSAPLNGIEISALYGSISNIKIGNGENVKFFENEKSGILISGNVDTVIIHANFNRSSTTGVGIKIIGEDTAGNNSPKNVCIENSRFNGYSFDEPAIALRASDGKISNENVVAISGNYFGNDVDEEDVEEMIVHKHDFNNAG